MPKLQTVEMPRAISVRQDENHALELESFPKYSLARSFDYLELIRIRHQSPSKNGSLLKIRGDSP